MEFWNALNARMRTAITLAFLAVLLCGGVAWGLAQVTKPFPGKVDPPVCVDTSFAAGDALFPQDVTVSVLNASSREGLAGRTMQLFVDAGFARGQSSNAPPGTDVPLAEVWVSEKGNAAARLVRSQLGKVPVQTRPDNPVVGVTVVVGDQFGELRSGVESLTLKQDTVVCSPPLD